MIIKTIYEAPDKTQFDTPEECQAYERMLRVTKDLDERFELEREDWEDALKYIVTNHLEIIVRLADLAELNRLVTCRNASAIAFTPTMTAPEGL